MAVPVNPIGIYQKTAQVNTARGQDGFLKLFADGLREANRLQNTAVQATRDLALGGVEDVHKAVLAVEKANLALDFTIQMRNRLVEAYQEIMRMQV